MASRVELQEKKDEKHSKRVSKFVVAISLTFILVTLLISSVVYLKYRTTQEWTSSKLNTKLANVPPEFAKNTYTSEMSNDITKLGDIIKSIKVAENNNGLDVKTISTARKTLATSTTILKRYEVTTGEAVNNLNDLKLYIDIYDGEKNAYDKPDAGKISQLIATVNKKQIEKETKTNTEILKRLNSVSDDYQKLNVFLDKYIPTMGTITKDVIMVDPKITKDVTNDMKSQIDKSNLTKFPNIAQLKRIISSHQWDNILETNSQAIQKSNWDTIVTAFKALTQSQYLDVSKVRTLEDATKLGLTISGNDIKTGFDLLPTSPVTLITANGTKLDTNQYVRKDATIVVTINPTYKKIQVEVKPTPSTEPSTSSNPSSTIPDSKPSTSESTSSTEQSSTTAPSSTEPSNSTTMPKNDTVILPPSNNR